VQRTRIILKKAEIRHAINLQLNVGYIMFIRLLLLHTGKYQSNVLVIFEKYISVMPGGESCIEFVWPSQNTWDEFPNLILYRLPNSPSHKGFPSQNNTSLINALQTYAKAGSQYKCPTHQYKYPTHQYIRTSLPRPTTSYSNNNYPLLRSQ